VLAALACGVASAGDIRRNVHLNVPNGANSIDFVSTGDVGNAAKMPAVSNGNGNVPYDNYGFGAPDSKTGLGSARLVFDNPLAAGAYSMDVYSPIPIKKLTVAYDFPNAPANFSAASTQYFASLYFNGDPSHTTLVGENLAGISTASVDSITATVVTGLDSFFADNWATVAGTNFTFAGGTIAAGADGVSFGTLSYGPYQWLRVTSVIDGQTQVAAFRPTPEPSAVVLLASGGLAAIGRRWPSLRTAGARPGHRRTRR
jgi:hypothetical protein